MNDHDVIVLGGGSAGTAAAAAATAAGARTLMVNEGELGGLCILRGCMPTKALLASAHALHAPSRAESFGVRFEGRMVPDFPRMMARKDEQVRRFQRAKIRGVEGASYEVLPGRGRFAPGGRVEVDGRVLHGRSYVVATGSEPNGPAGVDLPAEAYLTSDDVMRLESAPASLVVQGAGPIGLELAQFFARIGTRVLLVNRSALLSHHDLEAGAELRRALEGEMDLAVPGRLLEVRSEAAGMRFVIEEEGRRREHVAEAFLVATGRHAALDGLGLEHVGLRPERGRLEHDPQLRTTHQEIWVAGDATGSHQVLHLANQEGAVAGWNAAGGRPERSMDYRLAMAVVFTDPPFAKVGLTPVEAAREGREVAVGCARFPETGRAITMGVEHGLWKLVADPETSEVLGSVIVGPRADDLIHLVAQQMHHRVRAAEILEMPWYHPTLSEVMLDLARDLARQVPPRRGGSSGRD